MTKPTPADLRPGATCRYCGAPFRAARISQDYCTRAHKVAAANAAAARGKQAVPLLLAWRASRGTDRRATLGDIAALVDRWIAEDRRRRAAS